MKRLLAAAVLALMVHGLLFMLAPFQKPERTGRQADDSGRISVSLEHYSPRHIEDDAQEEVALADLEPLDEPGKSEEVPRERDEPVESRETGQKEKIREEPEETPQEDRESQEPKPDPQELAEQPPPVEEPIDEERPDAREDSSEHEEEESDPQPREESVAKEELDTEQVPVSALKSGEKAEISRATRDLSEMLEKEALSQQEIKEARPLYRDNPPPEYPRRAMQRNQQGTVFLEVLVNSRGRVEEIKVAESSGYSILDRAARDAVRDWVFEPGRKAGRPVDTWVRLPVRFELQ